MGEEICEVVEEAIDIAFSKQKLLLKFYSYLQQRKAKRKEVDKFIESYTAVNLNLTVIELENYLQGGQDSQHKQLREAYGHIPKPQARKIKVYLYGILEDARRYSHERRPGRRKKQSK